MADLKVEADRRFEKGYTSNWFEKAFVIKKLKILFHEHFHVIENLNGELQKSN